MEPQKLYARYRELQRYVGWSEGDAARIRIAGDCLAPHFPALIDDFYDQILQHEATRRIITGGETQIARLKGTLRQWIAQLFAGPYDENYVAQRWRVGRRHAEIGLDQTYASAALARLRSGMVERLASQWRGDPLELLRVVQSLGRLLDLDLAIIEDSYKAEQLLESQQRALRSERLATIGQMAAALAHEGRNALQRIQASAETLELELEDHPESLDLVIRIQRAQEDLRRLFDEIRGFAAPVNLDLCACSLAGVWREAWELLAPQRKGRDATLTEDAEAPDLTCVMDRFRMVQVFRNLLENALAACPDPVEIRIRAAPAELDEEPAITVSVADNGPGIPPEHRARVFEPFFSTKTKGVGLGMAIARRNVEAHGGSIDAAQPQAAGAKIIVTLPRRPAMKHL
jgi:signal transduction histidine kinase